MSLFFLICCWQVITGRMIVWKDTWEIWAKILKTISYLPRVLNSSRTWRNANNSRKAHFKTRSTWYSRIWDIVTRNHSILVVLRGVSKRHVHRQDWQQNLHKSLLHQAMITSCSACRTNWRKKWKLNTKSNRSTSPNSFIQSNVKDRTEAKSI